MIEYDINKVTEMAFESNEIPQFFDDDYAFCLRNEIYSFFDYTFTYSLMRTAFDCC